jgi:hypothetical protein
MAEAVAVFIAGKPPDARLFAVPPRTAEMIQTDLAAARKAWIKGAETKQEREARRTTTFLADIDGSGRVVDFHALRHTFITRLARSGVAPAVAKSLARHSTIVLTMDHLHAHAHRRGTCGPGPSAQHQRHTGKSRGPGGYRNLKRRGELLQKPGLLLGRGLGPNRVMLSEARHLSRDPPRDPASALRCAGPVQATGSRSRSLKG